MCIFKKNKGTSMTWDEYNRLFHKEQLNLIAFKRLMDCDEEVLRLVNSAIEMERYECAKILDANAMACHTPIMRSLLQANAQAIRVRGQA